METEPKTLYMLGTLSPSYTSSLCLTDSMLGFDTDFKFKYYLKKDIVVQTIIAAPEAEAGRLNSMPTWITMSSKSSLHYLMRPCVKTK